MLAVDFKVGGRSGVGDALQAALERYVRSQHGEAIAQDHAAAFRQLGECRQAVAHSRDRSAATLDQLKRYHGLLSSLQRRLPFSETTVCVLLFLCVVRVVYVCVCVCRYVCLSDVCSMYACALYPSQDILSFVSSERLLRSFCCSSAMCSWLISPRSRGVCHVMCVHPPPLHHALLCALGSLLLSCALFRSQCASRGRMRSLANRMVCYSFFSLSSSILFVYRVCVHLHIR
jgi:hypothetical protein